MALKYAGNVKTRIANPVLTHRRKPEGIFMLVIKQSQIAQFSELARLRFAATLVDHLAAFSPPLFEAVGAEQMRRVVDFGMARAAAHGFSRQGPVRLYLESMLLFGSHFETDPQYPWAAEILAAETVPEMLRAEQLYAAVMDYRREVVGPADVHAINALRALAALARGPLPVTLPTLAEDIIRQIRLLHPRKAAFTGDEALGALVAKATRGARQMDFADARGAVLVSLLMLSFGHGCGADLLYPWIAATLRDPLIANPQARARRLERKALTWLDHVIAHFDKQVPA